MPPPIGVTTNNVETAAQLQWALENAAKDADAIIMTAAVADYRPGARGEGEAQARRARREDRRSSSSRTPICSPSSARRGKGTTPLLVGFAAETEDVIENARKKLVSKKCDLIVANDVSEPNAGFAVDTNHVQLVDHDEVDRGAAGAEVRGRAPHPRQDRR